MGTTMRPMMPGGMMPGGMMPGGMMPGGMMGMTMRPMTPGGMTPGGMTPGGMVPGGMTPGGMMPGGMMPGGMMGMTMRPMTPGGMTPGMMPGGGIDPRPGMIPGQMTPGTQQPTMPGGAGAVPMGQLPMGPPIMGQTPPAGQIVPRPVGGLAFNPEAPSSRLIPAHGLEGQEIDATTTMPEFAANFRTTDDAELIAEESRDVTDRTETDSDKKESKLTVITQDEKNREFITESKIEEVTAVNNDNDDDQLSMVDYETEPLTVTEGYEYTSRTIMRQKRSYDVFDVLQDANKCDRAYRICITRSRHYVISKFKNRTKSGNVIKNTECPDEAARIVNDSGEQVCPPTTSNEGTKSVIVTAPPRPDDLPVGQGNDPLGAVVIKDDSPEDTVYYPSHNSPYTMPITSYSNAQIYPRQSDVEIREHLHRSLNDDFIFNKSSEKLNASNDEQRSIDQSKDLLLQ